MTTYIGLDPGAGGGAAVLTEQGGGGSPRVTTLAFTGRSEHEVVRWLREIRLLSSEDCYALLEQIAPATFGGPFVPRHAVSGVAKLYGSYRSLRAVLVTLKIPFFTLPPVSWQRKLGLPPRKKGDDKAAGKRALKAAASELFPRTRVTLATADALLLAELCRRSHVGE